MSVPYDEIVRHAWGPGDVVCNACHAGMQNYPCGEDWCACVCNPSAPEPEPTVADVDFPEFVIPIGPQNTSSTMMTLGPLFVPPAERSEEPPKHKMRAFIARWEVPFAIVTVVAYFVAILLVVWVFPDVSNLWVSLFVLFGGFTSSMLALASVLKTRE